MELRNHTHRNSYSCQLLLHQHHITDLMHKWVTRKPDEMNANKFSLCCPSTNAVPPTRGTAPDQNDVAINIQMSSNMDNNMLDCFKHIIQGVYFFLSFLKFWLQPNLRPEYGLHVQMLHSPPSLACCRKLSRTVAAWSTLSFSVFWLRVSDREETPETQMICWLFWKHSYELLPWNKDSLYTDSFVKCVVYLSVRCRTRLLLSGPLRWTCVPLE